MQPGDEWVYRLRDSAPSERVRVISIVEGKRGNFRADVEFLDRNPAGEIENVPGKRLRARWSELGAFEARELAWRVIASESITAAEEAASEFVYTLLMPMETAAWSYDGGAATTCITDHGAFAELVGFPVSELEGRASHIVSDGETILSPVGTALVAEALCRKHTTLVLNAVFEEEQKARDRCLEAHPLLSLVEPSKRLDPSAVWRSYLRSTRPKLEVLRQWCGHQSVVAHERLSAAEQEVQRLSTMAMELIRIVQGRDEHLARIYARRLIGDEITPYNVRPSVERPLTLDEIPVPETPKRRRW